MQSKWAFLVYPGEYFVDHYSLQKYWSFESVIFFFEWKNWELAKKRFSKLFSENDIFECTESNYEQYIVLTLISKMAFLELRADSRTSTAENTDWCVFQGHCSLCPALGERSKRPTVAKNTEINEKKSFCHGS